jgi:putative DNA primase/helicase
VVRLAPDEEVGHGLGLAEGIETALAVAQGFGWRPVWAATSAGAVRTFPVLPGIECLTVFADADDPGIEAARASCRKWAAAGREAVLLAPPDGDWNDAARTDRRVA